MGFLKEFWDFALKGNVLDLAVAVIIGGAFGGIVNSVIDVWARRSSIARRSHAD